MVRIDYEFLVTSWETASAEGRVTIEAEMVACYNQCERREEAREAVRNYLDSMLLELVEQTEGNRELRFEIQAAEIFLCAIDAYNANSL